MSSNEPNDIPPTEPRAPAASGGATATARPPVSTKTLSGKTLVPDLKKHAAGIALKRWYWIGVLPSAPFEHVSIGGETFPKMEERVVVVGNDTHRSPVIGALVQLTAEKFRSIRDRLPRIVVRFTSKEKQPDGPGSDVSVVLGDVKVRSRGFLITIPTDDEVKSRREKGQGTHIYHAEASDEPVANYVFAQLCPNQDEPSRREHYPEPLAKSGLEGPPEFMS